MIETQTFTVDAQTGDLIETATRFLDKAWPASTPNTTTGVPLGEARRVWSAAIELGWPWIAHRERVDAALSAAPTLAALFALLGRHPAPIPLAESCIWLPLLSTMHTLGVADDFLNGARLLTVATRPDSTTDDIWDGACVEADTVSGVKVAVAGAMVCDALVVAARRDGEPCLALVEAGQPGVTISPMPCYDRLDSPAVLRLDKAAVSGIVTGASVTEVADIAGTLGRAATAAELSALAASAVRLAIEHTGERRQFGRPVGSFQAVKHLLAEAWIDVYAAECAAQSAADRIASSADPTQARREADSALAFANTAARRAAEASLQAHGGIGFILEYRLSSYFNRILSRSAVGGAPRQLLLRLGRDAVAGHLTGD